MFCYTSFEKENHNNQNLLQEWFIIATFYHLWPNGGKLQAKIYVKKLWVITCMKYSVHLLDILTAATISPLGPM